MTTTTTTTAMTTDQSAALRLDGIGKSYPGVRALDGVSLELLPGRVHAILGENGAGKSTLVGIAAGSVVPDQGTIDLAGQTHRRLQPGQARAQGLAIVYQTPALAPTLTVVDAVLTLLPADKKPARGNATAWLAGLFTDLGLPIDPGAVVGDLSQREAHLIEIAAALACDPQVLVLDEPTEALGAEETSWLFDKVAELQGRGTAIAYITHRIPEVMSIAQDQTVLRDGRVVGRGDVSEFTADEIVTMIIGRSLETTFPDKASADPGTPVLAVQGLAGPGFRDVSFEVPRGQILGLAGVEGNGQRELLHALGGSGTVQGVVRVNGAEVSIRSHRAATASGVVLLPGDRLGTAMFGNLSIRENVVASALGDAMPAGWTRRAREYELTREAIDDFAVKTATLESTVVSLSGGSQQKVLLARARLANPRVLLVEDPTQGVDAGARVEIYSCLRELASSGVAVVVLSTDAVELEGLCDRVLVLSRGAVAADLRAGEITERAIIGGALLADHATSEAGEMAVATQGARARGQAPGRRRRRGAMIQPVALLALTGLVALATASRDAAFLQPLNLSQLLLASAVLMLVGLAQLVVVITGGIDLSVGSVVALSGVVVSYHADGGAGALAIGAVLAIAAGAAVGTVNGLLVTRLQVPAVIATLVSSVAVLGLAQVLRPQPGGAAGLDVLNLLGATIATVPVLLVLGLLVTAGMAQVLQHTSLGRGLRAVGADAVKANRMGVPVLRTRVIAMAMSGALSAGAGIALFAQTGIGDANSGQALTLASVTVIVIAGVSIFGGSGSAVSVAAAALLLQVITNALAFLSWSIAWQYWIQGIFVIVAAVLPMLARRARMRSGQS
ncbi:ATP-binding cassette domain-containing protein [Pimelobacter simplex]|uniref:ATP-binding cassette domain-containing protein n=1 Tax=Nocardioides simplex TaxID=2045 RepID=UPI00214F95A0|nr:ATP-binding cassette domain-containing protein [Pimelobacter simplex]UUW91476.1 ATP-binding cassette domain-containing protein [Pimelobacter simplex]UUW95304.1 ATP-binding cassette domain-containing protein [Pimelobacter simplex]